MKENKLFIIIILAIVLIVIFDMVTKYMAKQGALDLISEKQAQESLLQQQQVAGSQQDSGQGALGGLLSGLPLVGGLF